MSENQVPTLYEWAGGAEAFTHLTTIFYQLILDDPLLSPLFAAMPPEHPQRVAWALGEIFGGPQNYTEQQGGHIHLLAMHLNRHLTEEQRKRFASLMGKAADQAGLPTDPEFRAAFVGYLEWGTRIAVMTSQPGATLPAEKTPMPHWGWGVAAPSLEAPLPIAHTSES